MPSGDAQRGGRYREAASDREHADQTTRQCDGRLEVEVATEAES